jgi:hypothetical protein
MFMHPGPLRQHPIMPRAALGAAASSITQCGRSGGAAASEKPLVSTGDHTSSLAAHALQRLGVRRTTDLVGGYRAWTATGPPTVPGGSRAIA